MSHPEEYGFVLRSMGVTAGWRYRGLKGMDLEPAEKLASEIGRDFSPGITATASTWALAAVTCLPFGSARKPGFSATSLSVP
jgi:hypothetical protein